MYLEISPVVGVEFQEGAWWVLRSSLEGLPTEDDILARILPYFPKRGVEFALFSAGTIARIMRAYPRVGILLIHDATGSGVEARWIKIGSRFSWMIELSLYDREFRRTADNPRVEHRVVTRDSLALHLRLIFGEEVAYELEERRLRKIERYIKRHGLAQVPEKFIRRVLLDHFTWKKHIFQDGILAIISRFIILGSRFGWYRGFEPKVNRESAYDDHPLRLPSLFAALGIPLSEEPTREELEAALLLAVMEGKLKPFNFQGDEDEE